MNSYIDEIVNKKLAEIGRGQNVSQMGRVRAVRDYMVEIAGLEDAAYFDHVSIQRPQVGTIAEGYIEKISRDGVMVALTSKETGVLVGDEAVCGGEQFTMSFSEQSVGHVIDIFGNDLITGGRFTDLMPLPMESENIPLMDRRPVKRPMHTGITGIDLMYPIGRGQRQLIIGDKKTGKTQILLDTICNQANENMLCIYVAIGKTKKEVKSIYSELLRRGAMDYTIIVAAFNDTCPPMMRNTPYAALTIAQYYMFKENRDVFVGIDDLKRHADVCREIALLSGKVPGRDAYPPDIFYSHSRLLEQGCQHKNGGSITILPVCETKSGDITDYISTNIISITDGQIVLSAKNFERGFKPAVNYGLSVSRLGGAVQSGMMKKTGSAMRRELLTYLETKEVYELTDQGELSPALRESLRRGALIQNRLTQPRFAPKSEEQMVDLFSELL